MNYPLPFPMRQLKTFFIKTYGCQMNELDSEIMGRTPRKEGAVADRR